jgi:hypothetical protein
LGLESEGNAATNPPVSEFESPKLKMAVKGHASDSSISTTITMSATFAKPTQLELLSPAPIDDGDFYALRSLIGATGGCM